MKLDENKTYFLGRLTRKEKRELFDYLKNNVEKWSSVKFKNFDKGNYLLFISGLWVYDNSTRNKHVCAKELFNKPLTLENVQVDCSGLSKEQIEEIVKVFVGGGFKILDNNKERALKMTDDWEFLKLNSYNKVGVFDINVRQNCTTITYKQFMELFGSKSKCSWLIDSEVGIEKWLAYLDFEKEVIYGFDTDGVFFRSNNNRKILYESESIANQELVFKRLSEYAIKLGFVKGAKFKNELADIYINEEKFSLKDNVFYCGEFPIMKDGVWVEVIKQEYESGWYQNPTNELLMYHNFETNEKWGFCSNNDWSEKGLLEAKNGSMDNLIKASDETVRLRLIEEAKRRGFKEGVVVSDTVQGKNELELFKESDINLMNNDTHIGIWYNKGIGVWLMRNGVWMDVEKTLENKICESLVKGTKDLKETNNRLSLVLKDFEGVLPYRYDTEDKKWLQMICRLTYETPPIVKPYRQPLHTGTWNYNDFFNPQPHYDNSKGSLYKVATERNWNSYIFDVVKRLERGDKKDPLKQEIEKSIDVLKIWLNEL